MHTKMNNNHRYYTKLYLEPHKLSTPYPTSRNRTHPPPSRCYTIPIEKRSVTTTQNTNQNNWLNTGRTPPQYTPQRIVCNRHNGNSQEEIEPEPVKPNNVTRVEHAYNLLGPKQYENRQSDLKNPHHAKQSENDRGYYTGGCTHPYYKQRPVYPNYQYEYPCETPSFINPTRSSFETPLFLQPNSSTSLTKIDKSICSSCAFRMQAERELIQSRKSRAQTHLNYEKLETSTQTYPPLQTQLSATDFATSLPKGSSFHEVLPMPKKIRSSGKRDYLAQYHTVSSVPSDLLMPSFSKSRIKYKNFNSNGRATPTSDWPQIPPHLKVPPNSRSKITPKSLTLADSSDNIRLNRLLSNTSIVLNSSKIPRKVSSNLPFPQQFIVYRSKPDMLDSSSSSEDESSVPRNNTKTMPRIKKFGLINLKWNIDDSN